ncbi:monooxygenase [Streptomyces sp. MUSC 14]|uniref:FAD-dependent monooxygenase n=1 Tax=Streptomyces sp. MUSC 14 TaxID=1354889 RepID=UPI0008F57CD1|nr:FAD-dependent monooxygenase [Streptomyces sp. MUSC 14]OIJ90613.1 monooxygenase [Streptomyces sp. MUSC 14]
MEAHRELRVAVVGGGLGGLTLAIALHGHGITATVFEQAAELREIGAGVALSGNATRLLQSLGLGPALAEAAVVPSELVFRDGFDGTRLVAHPIGLDGAYHERFGAPYYCVQRIDLQRTLAGATGDTALRLGERVTGLRTGGRGGALVVETAAGTEFEADIVVGADGVHSTVRSWVTAEQPPLYTGTSGFRGLVPIGRMPAMPDPQALQFWVGPAAHVLHYPVGGDLVNFLAVLDGPAGWPDGSGPVAAEPGQLAGSFASWHPAVVEMLGAVPQSVRWGLLSQPPVRCWSRDRAVLIGDAVHAMLPHHGQGANQTIEDAVVLAGCLAGATRDSYREAFARYHRLRRARTRLVQRSSLLASDLLHLPVGPAARSRNEELKRFPDTFGWIHEYDARTGGTPAGAARPHEGVRGVS